MSRSLRARWTNAAGLVLLAVAIAWSGRGDTGLLSLALSLTFAAAALWASPILDRPTSSQEEVEARSARDRRVVVYARPGCSWCLRMRVALLGHRPAPTWVDVWDDEEASAFVRSVNGGNETVPTVVIDGEPVTNPPPGRVRAALRAGGADA